MFFVVWEGSDVVFGCFYRGSQGFQVVLIGFLGVLSGSTGLFFCSFEGFIHLH